MTAFIAVCMTACGNSTEAAGANDTDTVVVEDTLASDTLATDTLAADSVAE